jgi:hypothetical protein
LEGELDPSTEGIDELHTIHIDNWMQLKTIRKSPGDSSRLRYVGKDYAGTTGPSIRYAPLCVEELDPSTEDIDELLTIHIDSWMQLKSIRKSSGDSCRLRYVGKDYAGTTGPSIRYAPCAQES